MRGGVRTASALALLAVAVDRAVRQPGATLDDVLGRVAVQALAVGVAWWVLAAVVLLLGRLPGTAGRLAGVAADLVTPALLRRLLAAGVGAAVAAAPAAPALAAAPSAVSTATGAAPADLLPGADWPDPSTGGSAHASPQRAPARSADSVVVRTGDTLWDIAARHLGPHATPQEIAHEWPRWWRSNASVVGRDPDVLRPGQVLTAPD